MRWKWIVGGWAAALVIALAGCGTDVPYAEGSQEQAKVKGTVKVHGKALDGGELLFNAVNSKRAVPPLTAPIAKDGTFTITTYVGQNIVTVHPPETRKKALARDYGLAKDEEKPIDVKPGENTIDIDFVP